MESDFYEWSNRHSQVLIKLLECFNSANIRFFLLRNYKKPIDRKLNEWYFIIHKKPTNILGNKGKENIKS